MPKNKIKSEATNVASPRSASRKLNGNKKVKAVEKRVYGDQLQKFFKKHTGMNTYL